MCCVFFFKQKTAYEMRISDWSSDVCSSDLVILNVSCDCDVILQTFAMIESFRGWLSARPDEYVLGSSVAEIERAKREGKLAVFFDVEGGVQVQDEPETIGRLELLLDWSRSEEHTSDHQ